MNGWLGRRVMMSSATLALGATSYYADVSLTRWMAHTPHDVVAQHLKVTPSVLDRLPMQKQPVVPA